MKHTEADHGDFSLLRRAEKEIHEFALKIDAIQKETNEQERKKATIDSFDALSSWSPREPHVIQFALHLFTTADGFIGQVALSKICPLQKSQTSAVFKTDEVPLECRVAEDSFKMYLRYDTNIH